MRDIVNFAMLSLHVVVTMYL